MFQAKILSIVKNKKDIIFKRSIELNDIVIVDFFNIYCNIIKFNRYKTFSRETFVICMEILLNKLRNYKALIISKNIFEVENEYIKKMTVNNKNITYIIVEDTHLPKSLNRERDDYTCILLQKYILKMKKRKSCILTNDKYKNFSSILVNTKPFNLHIYKNGDINHIELTSKLIQVYNLSLKKSDLVTSEFKLIN